MSVRVGFVAHVEYLYCPIASFFLKMASSKSQMSVYVLLVQFRHIVMHHMKAKLNIAITVGRRLRVVDHLTICSYETFTIRIYVLCLIIFMISLIKCVVH